MYIKTSRNKSDNLLRLMNYYSGGSFFESVEKLSGGNFTIFTEADDDPDPEVNTDNDEEDPEVNTDNDEENPEVNTGDDETENDTNDEDGTDENTDNGDDENTTEDDVDDTDYEGADDMSSDPHDVGGDDEDPDAGSGDEDTGDDGGTEEEKEDDKPGTDFENMRRYNLYKKFMSLSDSITSYTDTLDAIVYDDDDLNTVTKIVSTKLKQLGDILYDYMTMKFENDSYTQALLFYHQVNAGIRMSFDLLASKSNNQKKR